MATMEVTALAEVSVPGQLALKFIRRPSADPWSGAAQPLPMREYVPLRKLACPPGWIRVKNSFWPLGRERTSCIVSPKVPLTGISVAKEKHESMVMCIIPEILFPLEVRLPATVKFELALEEEVPLIW